MITFQLLNNLALLLALGILFSYASRLWNESNLPRQFLLGLLFGVFAVIGMAVPVVVKPGVIFDGRSVILSVGALFGGPIVAIISVLIASVFRLIVGGAGTLTGILVIFSSSIIGVIYHYLIGKKKVLFNPIYIYLFGVIVHSVMLLLMLSLPFKTAIEILEQTFLSVIILYPLATLFLTSLLKDLEKKNKSYKELTESEQKFRFLFDSMAVGVTYQNSKGEIISANPAAERILGLTFEQMRGITSIDPKWKSIHEDGTDFPGESHPSMEALRTGKRVHNVVMGVYNPKSDETKWIKIDSIPEFREGEEKPYQVFTTFDDITEAKKAEEARRESDARFRIAQDMSPDGFTILKPIRDENNRVIDLEWVYENEAIAKLNGTDPKEVVGKRLLDLFPGHRGTELMKAYLKVAESGEPLTFEQSYSGETITENTWFRLVVVPMSENIAILAQDITERKKIEADLKESEEKFRTFFENAGIGVAIVNHENGSVIDCNDALCKFFGFPKSKMLSLSISDLSFEEDLKEDLNNVSELINGNISKFSMEKRYYNSEGKIIVGNLTSTLVRNSDGEPLYIIGMVEDITEKEEALKELKRSQELLTDAGRVAKVGGFELDLELMEPYLSDAVFEIYDLPKGKPPKVEDGIKFYAPEARPIIEKAVQEAIAEGKPYDLEVPFISAKGIRKWVRTMGRAEQVDGKAVRLVGAMQDITKQKEITDHIRESQIRYKTLFENQPTIIWEEDFSLVKKGFDQIKSKGITDFRQYFEDNPEEVKNFASMVKIVEVNETSLKILEATTKEEVIKNLPFYFDTQEAWEVFKEELVMLAMGKLEFVNEIPVRTIKGNRKQFYLKLVVHPDFIDDLKRVLVTFQDITELTDAYLEIKKSEEKFRSYVTNATEGIYLGELDEPIDLDLSIDEQALLMYKYSYIADCNDAFAKIYGLEKASDAIGMRQTDAHGVNDNPTNLSFLRKLAESNYTVKDIITEEVDVNGNKIYISNNTFGIIENNKLLRIWASQLDVTEKVVAELRLKESEEKYRELVESSHDLIWAVDAVGKITFLNNAAKDIYGYQPEELIGKNFLDFVPKEQFEKDSKIFMEAINLGKEVINYESQFTHKDGHTVYLLANSRILRDESGNFLGTTGISKDVTSRKNAEKIIRESEESLRFVLESSKTGYWDMDILENKTIRSARHDELFGYKEMLPKWGYDDFIAHVHKDYKELVDKTYKSAMKGEGDYDIVFPVVWPDKTIHWVWSKGRFRLNSEGQPVRVSGIMTDVDNQKKAENEILKSREELRALAQHLSNIREDERKNIARDIHDELGQILTSIKLNLGLLNRQIKTNGKISHNLISDELVSISELIDKSIKNIRKLISQLRPEYLDNLGLIPAVENYLEDFKNISGINCILNNSVENEKFDSSTSIILFRIVQESLTNVARHSKASKVSVNFTYQEGKLILTIEDNGVGFVSDKNLKIKSFGLIGMQERASALGGSINIKSKLNKGTKVCFECPLI